MAAKDFNHSAVRGLVESAAAEFLGEASPQKPELSEPVDHALWNLGFAIDRCGVDLFGAEAAKLSDHLARPRIPIQIGICQELIPQVSAKKQSLGKSDLVQAIAQHLFGLGHLLFVIHFHDVRYLAGRIGLAWRPENGGFGSACCHNNRRASTMQLPDLRGRYARESLFGQSRPGQQSLPPFAQQQVPSLSHPRLGRLGRI